MKPRKRLPQGQSARLYLRNRDHRDVIYNDVYHNAIWANTENIDDELVWIKYPNKGLITARLGWIDAERQFQYIVNGIAVGQRTKVIKLECGAVIRQNVYSESTWSVYITEDGFVWTDITDNGQFGNYPYKFGIDGICNVYAVASGLGYYTMWCVDAVRFVKNEETGKWGIQRRHFEFERGQRPPWTLAVCNDNDGIIVCQTSMSGTYENIRYNEKFLKVNWDGTLEERYSEIGRGVGFPTSGYSNQYGNTIRYCKNGNKLAYAYFGYSYSSGYEIPIVGVSTDDGNTWTVTSFGHCVPETGYQYEYRMSLFCRGGNFYLLFGARYPDREGAWNAREVVMYASYGGTDWSKVTLPDYTDVPFITEGGKGIYNDTTYGDTIRIAIDPQNVSEYDLSLFDYFDGQDILDYGDYNIMFSKGEMPAPSEEEFWAVFGRGETSNSNICIYFDNRNLDGNNNCFAWHAVNFDNQTDGADYLMRGDYCVPYDTPTPFDPYQYPFWDYYKWVSAEQIYEKVPRVDLDQYPNWHVIVVEYLPYVGANSVLYKVPRYNV